MKKALTSLVLCFCMVFSVFALSKPADASAILKSLGSFSTTKSLSVDVTHDGKADTVKFVISKSYDYITKVSIYVNGKLAKTETDSGAHSIYVQYLKYSNAREFLYVYGVGDSGMPYIQHVLAYNTSTKKFSVACDLSKYSAACKAIESVNASDCSFKVKYACMPVAVGNIYWHFSYKFNSSTQTFKIVKQSAKSKYFSSYDPGDGLESYLKKNMYKTAQSVTMYTGIGLTKVAFTVPANKFVTFIGIYARENGILYAEFKYGTKLGWIKINDPITYKGTNYGAFKGIDKRGAGGFYG